MYIVFRIYVVDSDIDYIVYDGKLVLVEYYLDKKMHYELLVVIFWTVVEFRCIKFGYYKILVIFFLNFVTDFATENIW